MKILLIHSYYQKKGGEDVTFEQESQLLAQAATVKKLSFSNRAGLWGAVQFLLSIWNIHAASKLRRAIREFQPDIIHCYNLHFGVGPIAICVAKKRGIPITLTLQNFRLLCPSATLALDGELFLDSLARSFPWEAIRRKAYRDSALLSFWLAFIIWFHKRIGTWRKVDAYIVLTDFAKSIFVNSSFALPAEKIVIKPNSIDFLPSSIVERGEHFLFVGRLSMEKGIKLLLDVFGQTGFPLRIVGEGPLEAVVREAGRRHSNIQYLGPLSREQVRLEMSECTALVFPSIWYEGLPLTILEAFASGTPVIASNLGAMELMIVHEYNGLHFNAGNNQSLIEQLKTWIDIDKKRKEQYRSNALATYYANYAPEKNRAHLLKIYKQQLRHVRQLILLLLFASKVFGQTGPYYGGMTAEGVFTNPNHVPFWLRSDQCGSVPLAGGSASLIANVGRSYDSSRQHCFDWGFSLETRANFGNDVRAAFVEAYLKARFSIFDFRVGRDRDFMGLVDSSLSSGAFSVSGNALGIPKLEGAIRDWYNLPFAGHLFSIKGNFAFGRVGSVPINIKDGVPPLYAMTYFHQASFYGRFGKPDWRLKLEAGINHQVYWGSEADFLPGEQTLPSWKILEYVVIGKTYEGSKIGNHLGSVDVAAEYQFDNFGLMLYRQFFYDEGALAHLANLADGMNGVSITNKRPSENGFSWHKFVLEWFYSMNQAGYPWSKRTPSGDENYYNNYQYLQGWSYLGQALGNPFITPYPTTRKGLPNYPADYFNNNRVCAFYGAFEGALSGFAFTTRLSYSLNYGTFATSPWGYSTGGTFVPPQYGIFPEENQFSAYLKISKFINDNTELGITGSLDNGGLFYNSAAFVLHARRIF